jgi:hypothetical protein
MSETQRYKVANEFTLCNTVVPYLRRMVRARLDVVNKVMRDGSARDCFSYDELSELALECLTLARLLDTMPKDEAGHA